MNNEEDFIDGKQYVVKHAKDVSICLEDVSKIQWEVMSYLNTNIQNDQLSQISKHFSRFTLEYHPDKYDSKAADWLFVLNTMNFALWNPKATKQWTVNELTGYQALCVAIKRAISNNIPIWNPKYYAYLKEDVLKIIFKGDDKKTSIPLINERLKILHHVGNVLLRKYKGTFRKCIELCKNDPSQLRRIILKEFESYQDIPLYADKEVNLLTKLDTLVNDIGYCFRNDKLSFKFSSYIQSSMFADYRSSQVLLHFGILRYSKELMTKLENNEQLKYGSKEEVEIRSCSIVAIELLSKKIKEIDNLSKKVSPKEDINYFTVIDNFLWDFRHVHDQLLMETQPLPNIKCVYHNTMAEDNSSNYDEVEFLAAKFIAEKAKDIYINEEGIKKLAQEVIRFLEQTENDARLSNKVNMFTIKFFRRYDYYLPPTYIYAIDWLFVLHTLNFSLWNPKDTKQWTVNRVQGFSGLCSAMRRISDKRMRIWDPKCYTKMTKSEFEHMFQGDDSETPIPLIDERLRILREVGQVLLNKYKGTFVECIKSSGKDANNLVKLLVNEFESYRDESLYEGLTVCFYNKARALVSDVWSYYKNNKLEFKLDTKNRMSTMFINYCAPQVLLHFNVLRYSDRLVDIFENNNEPLEHGSREELEIRGCSLFAFIKVCEEVQEISKGNINEVPVQSTEEFNVSMLVDNFLFKYITDKEQCIQQEPFHYIRTIHY
ncbi:uncharacterized protein [Anoplolepis gracilipes]|uniref:uncharacterized protein n=1 Tax=Anoplolepis gracilipes TaxID=354296 RepID=UPI003BA09761